MVPEMKTALRPELQRRPLEEIHEFERVTGERVIGFDVELLEHSQVGQKVTRVGVRVAEAKNLTAGRPPRCGRA